MRVTFLAGGDFHASLRVSLPYLRDHSPVLWDSLRVLWNWFRYIKSPEDPDLLTRVKLYMDAFVFTFDDTGSARVSKAPQIS